MTGPMFHQPDFGRNRGARGRDLGETVFSKLRYPLDRVGTSAVGPAAKIEAGRTDYGPNSSLELPCSGQAPVGWTSGRPCTTPHL